ncbi:hypothetical protein J2W86_000970 [Delftia lacustris]|nr:hypothetical protein [Delftia lacustris]
MRIPLAQPPLQRVLCLLQQCRVRSHKAHGFFMQCEALQILHFMARILRTHQNLYDGPGMARTGCGSSCGRGLQGVARQQCQFSPYAQFRHDSQVRAHGWPGIAGLDCSERAAGYAYARGHLDRAQPLLLAQALEPVTELQKQLALKKGGLFWRFHLSIILSKT